MGMKKEGRFSLSGIVTAIFTLTVIIHLFSAPLAAAQETMGQESDLEKTASNDYKLDTLIVTAEKREENVQDVPASISVVPDIKIEETGIANIVDLTRFTPNVYVNRAIVQNVIVIRGITTDISTLSSPAGFYVDDVNLPLHLMHNPDLFDIERVEVLKGPQGTLYGRNSESGVINIITKQPDNEFRAKVFGEYGMYDTEHGTSPSYRAGAGISGPVVNDQLYLGFAGQWETSDGFIKNVYNGDDKAGKIDRLNGRGTLRWTPSARWDISLIADVMKTDDNPLFIRFSSGAFETERHEVDYDVSEYYWEQESNGQNLRIKYEGNAFNLVSVTGRRDYEEKILTDQDLSPLPLYGSQDIEYEDDILSQEVRISSPDNHGPFEWLAGLYGFRENLDIDFKSGLGNRKTDIDIKGCAVFGQGTYTLFDSLHLTAGVRYEYQESEGKQDYALTTYSSDLDDSEVLPKFSVAYDFTDKIMAYFSVSKGYLTGGYHYSGATSKDNFTYDPEYTWNYEIGLKTSWWDNKVVANLAAFYIDMKDKQVSEWNPNSGVSQITNAAKAHSMGAELELQARPVQGLELIAGIGYLKAKVDDWIATEWNSDHTALVQYDYKDKYLPNVPKYTYNFGVQYRHSTGLLGRVDLLGTGSFYGDAKNKLKLRGYELVNLRAGYEGEHVDVILWCKNLFDKHYQTMQVEWAPNTITIDGDSRMFGATVTYRF
jgi:iron complex outermembrane receptor protein